MENSKTKNNKKSKRFAVIGTYWKTLAKANADAIRKVKRFRSDFSVLKHTNGYLVVSARQVETI